MADEEQLVSDESLQAGPSSLPADLPGEAPPSETTAWCYNICRSTR